MKGNNKTTAIIYYLAATACYISSILFLTDSSKSLGIMWLCIGSANLCLGSVWLNRYREEEKKKKAEEAEEIEQN